MSAPFTDAAETLRLVERLAAVGACIASAEMLTRRGNLRDPGLLGWPVSQLRHRALAGGAARVLDAAFAYPNVLALVGLRAAAAACLAVVAPRGGVEAALVATVAATSVALPLRSPFGMDGADQMATYVFCLLALALLLPHPAVIAACLWFIALQSCLSYLTAGVAKAVSREWMGGMALVGISSTRMYGAPPAAAFLRRHPALVPWLSRSVVAAECLFPLALVTPRPVALLLLAGGLLFHLLSAVFMGLNTFLWSFAATYPAILYCAARL